MALSKEQRLLAEDLEDGILRGQLLSDRDEHLMLGHFMNWVSAHNWGYQFNGDEGLNAAVASTMAPAALELSTEVEVHLTDASNITNPFNQTGTVVVTVSGGTATGKTVNGDAGPITLTMVDGKASFTAAATAAGTMILDLSAPSPAGLDVDDQLTITFS